MTTPKPSGHECNYMCQEGRHSSLAYCGYVPPNEAAAIQSIQIGNEIFGRVKVKILAAKRVYEYPDPDNVVAISHENRGLKCESAWRVEWEYK